jgi:hypothetical protein
MSTETNTTDYTAEAAEMLAAVGIAYDARLDRADLAAAFRAVGRPLSVYTIAEYASEGTGPAYEVRKGRCYYVAGPSLVWQLTRTFKKPGRPSKAAAVKAEQLTGELPRERCACCGCAV